MPTYAVILERFGEWDWSRGMREQVEWDRHAAFMDALADERFILLGGPFASGRRVLHVIESSGEEEIRARLAEDPWYRRLLRIESIEEWDILLGVERHARLRGED